MTAKDRIEALVANMHTNVKSFSELCGYDRPQAFYDILKGKTKNISPTMCDRILGVFPHLSRVWLMTGEGQMTAEASPKTSPPAEKKEPQASFVPLVPLAALAGPITSCYQEGCDLSRCEMVISPAPEADLAIPVSGDSMEPEIANGSIAFLRRINEAAFIPWGAILVLDTENGVFIKKVVPDEADQSYIWAESLNSRYHPMHIPKSSIAAMYRILYVTKPYFTM